MLSKTLVSFLVILLVVGFALPSKHSQAYFESETVQLQTRASSVYIPIVVYMGTQWRMYSWRYVPTGTRNFQWCERGAMYSFRVQIGSTTKGVNLYYSPYYPVGSCNWSGLVIN